MGGRGAQSGEPGIARARLKVSPARHRHARAPERHAERVREALGDVELPSGFRPQPVIDPVRDERMPHASPKERKHVKERHRVGPAAHSGKHDVPAGEERVGPDGARGEGDEGGGMRTHALFV
jgi:hypothetical protein